ncbi:hypothetical protein Q4574_21465, partial [Aliiglaciecola sp. 3_MG-2023]|uniref:hypothetical protein n=1 Tax=Aliiglaciecola sp. 3_MG-2023 TaxID=3062644 RepID=UPI0026E3B23E
PKRSTGADCKSAGSAFAGSNPAPSTIFTVHLQFNQVYGVTQCVTPPLSTRWIENRFASIV